MTDDHTCPGELEWIDLGDGTMRYAGCPLYEERFRRGLSHFEPWPEDDTIPVQAAPPIMTMDETQVLLKLDPPKPKEQP